MSIITDGIFKIFGKIADQFQGRIERLKNEKDGLNAERDEIFGRKPITGRDADRLSAIDKRVAEIKSILGNDAKD